jgi:hypothetical protein
VCISESLVILARLYDEQAKASAPKQRGRPEIDRTDLAICGGGGLRRY